MRFPLFFAFTSGALLLLASQGLACMGRVTSDSGNVAAEQQEIIEILQDRAQHACATCEEDALRKVEQAKRCRATLCDFESGNLCNYVTAGDEPGLPDSIRDDFYEQYPQYGMGDEADSGEKWSRATDDGAWAEHLHPEDRRKKRKAAPAPINPDVLLLKILANPELLNNPAVQRALESIYPTQLERLGMDVPIEDRKPSLIAGQSPLEPAPPPERWSKRTWGNYWSRQPFGEDDNVIDTAAEGERYAATWVKQGDLAIMQTNAMLTDNPYYVYYSVIESNEDIQMRLCCGTLERCVAQTPWPRADDEDFAQWRTHSGRCPKGTDLIIFTCHNRGYVEGFCGVDNIQLFTFDGHNYCKDVDVLYGDDPSEDLGDTLPDNDDVTLSDEERSEVERLIKRIRGQAEG